MRPSDPSAADAPTVIRSEGSHAPPTHAVGRVIGPYELTESLGAGGMATVWKAVDRDAGRTVALKILPADLARDPAVVARFKGEARAAAALDHPAIAKAFQCGEWDGVHAIATQLIPGETLKQKLDRDGPITPRDAVAYLLDLAGGLGHAASRGVTHRDVKPSNVMVTPENRAVLIDMGLARRDDAGTTAGAMTTSGMTLGTFDYVSPEQALDPRTADVRSDLYSLGCTFYHVLTGRPPVPEGTAARKLQAHRHERPPDPRRLNPAIPDDLALVLSRLMVKGPAERYQTPADLGRDLRVLREQLDAPAGVVGPRLVEAPGPVVPTSWLAAGLAVVAALYVVAAPSLAPRPASPAAGARAAIAPADAPPADPSLPATLPDGYRLAATADDLVTLLRDHSPLIRLEPGREYDLTAAEDVVFTGPSLVLETVAGAAPATLILPATAAVADGTPTVRGAESVVLRRLVVRTVPSADEGPVIEPCGIAFAQCGSVSLVECRFETHDGLRAGQVAAVAVTADAKAELTVRSCQFPAGSVALRLAGPVHATVAESAFGPHEAVFDLDAGRGTIALSHTTFLFRPDGGAAFDAAPGASFAISAGHCAFAAAGPPPVPAMMMGGRAVPVLLRSDAATGTAFAAVAGEPNVYFRVDAAAFGETVVPFEKRAEAKVDDAPAVVLAAAPWAEADPLGALAPFPPGADPWRAFRLRLDLPAVRVPRDVVVGARHRTADGAARVYPGDWPPPRPVDLAAEPVKLWWPAAPEGEALPRNASRRLDDLVAAARPGDAIEIRHTGRLAVKPVRLVAADGALTIRAAAGSRPVLVPEGAFVELADGAVTLDGLDVRLTGRGDPRAVAKVTGGGSVVLRRCVVTADGADDRVAVVSVSGGEADMRAPAGPGPRVRVDECLIRGTGRGVAVTPGRPFAVEVVGSVVALDGPFLAADAPPRDPLAARGKLTLTKSTFALAGPLVEWKAGRSGAVPFDVEATQTFFAAVGPGKPLVVVDGGDALDTPDRVLTWTSEGCRYAHWDRAATFFEARPADGGPPLRLDADEWLRQVSREPGRALSRGRSPRFPDSPRALAEALPSDFPPPRRPDAFGPADPAGADPAGLPKPVE
jgi:hypothetical protein